MNFYYNTRVIIKYQYAGKKVTKSNYKSTQNYSQTKMFSYI